MKDGSDRLFGRFSAIFKFGGSTVAQALEAVEAIFRKFRPALKIFCLPSLLRIRIGFRCVTAYDGRTGIFTPPIWQPKLLVFIDILTGTQRRVVVKG